MTDTTTPEPDNVVPEGELERRRFIAGEIERIRTATQLAVHGFLALESAGVPVASWLPILAATMPEPFDEKLGKDMHYGVAMIEAAAAIFRGQSVFDLMPKIIATLTTGSPAAGFGATIAAKFLGIGKPAHDWPRPPGFPKTPIGGEEELRDLMDGDKDPTPLDDSFKTDRMRQTIARLFETAPKLTLPNGDPDPSQAPALQCHVVLRSSSVPPVEGVLSTTPEGGLRLMSVVAVDGPRPLGSHPRAEVPKKTVMLEQFFDYGDVIAVCVQREVSASPGSGIIS